MDVVITTVFPPTAAMRCLAEELAHRDGRFWVIGDRKGPSHYDVPRARFYDIDTQNQLPFHLAPKLPEKHYARKNLGYLLAIQAGASCVIETDDDNQPLPPFWQPRAARLPVKKIAHQGWWNIYREFSGERIWPRGFPLEEINASFDQPPAVAVALEEVDGYIQQGLANSNPDVDAVYRLTGHLPVNFQEGPVIALAPGCWCPFNSQNTTFFPPAYPLMYLPVFCRFRMTDIWRSWVAQRCLWEMPSQLCFVPPTVKQDRNEHNLLKDFEDELPGYLNNQRIRGILEDATLRPGTHFETVGNNLLSCYEALVREGVFPETELALARAWIQDLEPLIG